MEIEVTDDIRVAPESKNMIRILSEVFEKRTPIDINGKQYMVVAKSHSVFSLRRMVSVKPAEWTGEGLPPVGAELEAGFACEDFKIWHKGVCVAVGEDPEGREDLCVVLFGKKIAQYSVEGRRMRPIRTPEQIAAEDRMNKAIALYTAVMNHPGSSLWHRLDSERQEHFLSLVDAGWQQVKP